MACESCASSHLKGPDVSKRVLGIYSTGPQVGGAYNKVHLRKELHSPPFRYMLAATPRGRGKALQALAPWPELTMMSLPCKTIQRPR